MTSLPVISFRNLDHSTAVEQHVVQRFDELKKYHPRIVGCDAVIGAPRKRQQSGREFEVHLTIKVPGPDVHIHESIGRSTAVEDVNLAVHRAFDAARRVLKKQKQKMGRVEVKQHSPILHGHVDRLFQGEGYGFIRADDGSEVYFERDNLTTGDWDKLVIDAKVRFREVIGEKGPFATNVAVQS
ncbi:MAG: HPF/RaiA family ribosome-associated protein [Hyphomicrobiales bacterium]|nr:HPF/RaiA family ribosome-associated protein [Hyphomicrobiales bacterium]